MEKAGLNDRKSNGIVGHSRRQGVEHKPQKREKTPNGAGCTVGVVPSGRYNFNNLQIEVESIAYPGL
jgi:hypothetical protein